MSFDDRFAYSLNLDNQKKEIGETLNLDYKSQGENLTVPFLTENSYTGDLMNYKYLTTANNSSTKTLELFKPNRVINPEDKFSPRFQVNTGNIPIDYTNPIAEGSFCIFNGKTNTGKFELMKTTMRNFVQENNNSIVIYNALSKQEAN